MDDPRPLVMELDTVSSNRLLGRTWFLWAGPQLSARAVIPRGIVKAIPFYRTTNLQVRHYALRNLTLGPIP